MIVLGAASSHAEAVETGSGSPQKKLSRTDSKWRGFRTPRCFMNAMVEGTQYHTVSPMSRMNLPGLMTVFWGGQHRQAPRSQAINMSYTDRSKVISNICETRSCSFMP